MGNIIDLLDPRVRLLSMSTVRPKSNGDVLAFMKYFSTDEAHPFLKFYEKYGQFEATIFFRYSGRPLPILFDLCTPLTAVYEHTERFIELGVNLSKTVPIAVGSGAELFVYSEDFDRIGVYYSNYPPFQEYEKYLYLSNDLEGLLFDPDGIDRFNETYNPSMFSY